MSFRSFVYWCALGGGWAAVGGWWLGHLFAHGDSIGGTGVKGMFLGMLIALALGLVDAMWVYSLRQWRVVPRVLVCVAVGTVGGLVGGSVGQFLYDEFANLAVFQIFGWVLTGLMVGVSIGSYDFLRSWVRMDRLGFPTAKVVRGVVGGALGGLLGGVLDWMLGNAWTRLFPAKDDLWSPSLTGFIALGLCIGLLIAVAQVVLTEAWLKVVAGSRKGRELLVNKPVLTIGRAESCDLGLFGDAMIEKLHARIYQQDGRYLIADNASTHGTFVNDQRIAEPTLLRDGDLIRVGNAYVRFSERKKKN
jgi:Inner membrane component of T3SS, cytoplasmic domain